MVEFCFCFFGPEKRILTKLARISWSYPSSINKRLELFSSTVRTHCHVKISSLKEWCPLFEDHHFVTSKILADFYLCCSNTTFFRRYLWEKHLLTTTEEFNLLQKIFLVVFHDMNCSTFFFVTDQAFHKNIYANFQINIKKKILPKRWICFF